MVHPLDTVALPFLRQLRSFGDHIAIHTEAAGYSYRDLADLVDAAAAALHGPRRLALVCGGNDLTSLVHYLGALQAGHVVLLAESESLCAAYDPDIVVAGGQIRIARAVTAHQLHPELALLLSTSGSTGSPKLVRLSYENLRANATAIADYLDIGDTDCAATTLPMHYCYGLSVVHSHLSAGAALLLTGRSVLEPEFWQQFRAHRATTFPCVPYTFDMLDHIGFAEFELPSLRYLTQAGGRLAPERVRAYAELGRARGWDLYVMYGATEATARMAYLPPRLAATHPDSIGVPIPGGTFSIDDGELVYHGPNVMLGYAETPADLALGRTVAALHTGDLARRTPDGLYQITGRRSRFVKLFGLRIDLQRVESQLAAAGFVTCCAEGADELVVAVAGDADGLRAVAAQASGLPPGRIRVCPVPELPRRSNGKPDYHAVRALAPDPPRDGVAALFADVLAVDPRRIGPDSTFVGLGGDSLSYVTMSVRLERLLGHLPPDWHRTPLAQLRPAPRRRAGRTLDTSVALRALAIVFVVGSHAALFEVWGGAHMLLAVAGYNLARFTLPNASRVRLLLGAAAAIAVPSMLWIGFALVVTDDYRWTNLLLLNKILGPSGPTQGHLWFVEVLVYFLLAVAAALAIPAVSRLERRYPFGFAATLLAVATVARYDFFGLYHPVHRSYSVFAFWVFALGWVAAQAPTVRHRIAVSLAGIAIGYGYFHDLDRELLVAAALLALVWLPSVRVPDLVARLAGALAGASLFVYLTHWQVYPLFGSQRLLAVLACLVAGVAIAEVYLRAQRWTVAKYAHMRP